MSRVKILRVWPSLLTQFGQSGCPKTTVAKNALPADVEIVDVAMDFQGRVAFKLSSDTYPELAEGMAVPDIHDVPILFQPAEPAGPPTLTLTRDDLAALLYDADRTPERRVVLEVRADGTWEAKP